MSSNSTVSAGIGVIAARGLGKIATGTFLGNISGSTAFPVAVPAASITGAINAPVILANSGVSASVTGTASETQLATVTIPANTMGTNGALRITTTWFGTASANNKQYRVRFSGSGGGAFLSSTLTNTAAISYTTIIQNKNATNSQGGGSVGAGSSSAVTGAVDTTAATTVYISGTLTNTGETITLVSYTVEFIKGV